jgi:ataxia telangiectasia mutated family protein
MTSEYKDLPTVQNIEERMSFPGGINKPKLITITDSHGNRRKQLVKGGQDDLRQDAVMQQFFRICNAFLRDAKSTAARNLSIRTYNAIPFSPSSGLLEWIDDTRSLLNFVVDGNNNFLRGLGLIQQTLAKAQEFRKTSDKLHIFKQCVKKCGKPRMGNVFLRRFPDPGSWYAARLAYSRSVAVNSMAGHIIGLGDRHTSNILLDKSTAEVIHIDLGIAFEQGKLLPTPEQVPFRLTRNMVDGMGTSGVEGVMRRCCEETLRVLKKQKDPLLTVLSVFIHDPLYKWALTYDRASKKQEDDDDQTLASTMLSDLEGNVDANRTLLVIQHKLEGIVGGTVLLLIRGACIYPNLVC